MNTRKIWKMRTAKMRKMRMIGITMTEGVSELPLSELPLSRAIWAAHWNRPGPGLCKALVLEKV